MKKIAWGLLTLVVGAQASAQSTRYFKNPIQDDKVALDACAIQGALYGIKKGEYGDILCFGDLLTGKEEKKTRVAVFHDSTTGRQYRFVVASENLTAAWGEQEGGGRTWKTVIKEADENFSIVTRAHYSTLIISQSWLYSDGVTVIAGRIPVVGKKISYPYFGLGSLDERIDEDFN
ncbi:MAG: hypothetical protein AB7F86_04920 [Bdellovibrionales bacterium]